MVRHGTRRLRQRVVAASFFVFNSHVSNAEQFMKKRLLVMGSMVLMSVVFVVSGQTAGPQLTNLIPSSISSQRALLDQYCVTCHNQKQKMAGLALDKLDLARCGENGG